MHDVRELAGRGRGRLTGLLAQNVGCRGGISPVSSLGFESRRRPTWPAREFKYTYNSASVTPNPIIAARASQKTTGLETPVAVATGLEGQHKYRQEGIPPHMQCGPAKTIPPSIPRISGGLSARQVKQSDITRQSGVERILYGREPRRPTRPKAAQCLRIVAALGLHLRAEVIGHPGAMASLHSRRPPLPTGELRTAPTADRVLGDRGVMMPKRAEPANKTLRTAPTPNVPPTLPTSPMHATNPALLDIAQPGNDVAKAEGDRGFELRVGT